MDAYLAMQRRRRRTLCDEAASRLSLAPASVEKDFWICWTLRHLFALPDYGVDLTFKGGTSLSKGWKLIQRFSEDVDVVVGRARLGFSGERAPDRAGISSKERDRRLDALRSRCSEFVRNELAPALRISLHQQLPRADPWSLNLDADDSDGQTLLFTYPSDFENIGYVCPVVRIELGARSDTEPVEDPAIAPYLAEAFPRLLVDASFRVRTVAPVRTFWEKAMLLHEEAHRREDTRPRPRLSRHYYDLWCLINRGVGELAVRDLALFERIAAHRSVFFRKSRAAQESLRRGSLRLLPRDEHRAAWQRDYAAMRETMFFGEPPEFDAMLAVVGAFGQRFNADGDPSQPAQP